MELVSIWFRQGLASGQKPLAAVRYTCLIIKHDQSYQAGLCTFPILTVQIAGVKYCQQYFIKGHGRYPIMSFILSYWRSAPSENKQCSLIQRYGFAMHSNTIWHTQYINSWILVERHWFENDWAVQHQSIKRHLTVQLAPYHTPIQYRETEE